MCCIKYNRLLKMVFSNNLHILWDPVCNFFKTGAASHKHHHHKDHSWCYQIFFISLSYETEWRKVFASGPSWSLLYYATILQQANLTMRTAKRSDNFPSRIRHLLKCLFYVLERSFPYKLKTTGDPIRCWISEVLASFGLQSLMQYRDQIWSDLKLVVA